MNYKSIPMILIYIIVAGLIILYLMGNKSVHQELTIEAKPEEVWEVLTDFESMATWNKVLIPEKGVLDAGEKIDYLFFQDQDTQSRISANVKRIIPNELIHQTGGIPGILTFNHKYMLKPEGDEVRLIIHEEYRGVGVPFWNPSAVEAAYGRLAQSLRQRVLTLNEKK